MNTKKISPPTPAPPNTPSVRFAALATVAPKTVLAAILATALFFSTNLFVPTAQAQYPSPAAIQAFDQYTAAVESQSSKALLTTKNFFTIDTLPNAERIQSHSQLQQGQPIITRTAHCPTTPCATTPGALIHDWTGTIFVPGVTLPQTLAALQDYDRDSDYYRPEVVQSKLLSKSGDHYNVFLRLKQKQLITVVLDTEYQVQYTQIDATHSISQSHSTRITEVENAGTPKEKILIPGDDHGFLWRLYTYWRFEQADGGVYIQCNAISLTRDIPTGLNWLVNPFTENIPRDSLRFTLTATRAALQKVLAAQAVTH